MSQENVERVRAVTEDLISGKGEFDRDGMLIKLPDEEFLAPDVEWDASEVPVLDISGVYRGVEAVRRYWREWFAAWEILHYEFRLLDAGDRVVALFDNQRMRGRSTGIEVPVLRYAVVMTIRDGLLVHWKLYMDQSEALEAVGLAEQDAPADSS
jgi:ketosteroid isomerase-like protein